MKILTPTYVISEKDYASIYKQKLTETGEQNLPVYQIVGLEDPISQIKTDYSLSETITQN